eukprot:CAMPEP_0119033378 /NCGR_PEP_ID=MMETSP1177-20130426/425_1 /TAXON_ID=2985 /ORGANISM="Ochromonas sp, Strain CCMP1899" /LENGTH=625 /DNA_ID=CAMNT_0006990089 /DNA_START=113 /DNA_END=1990 /DNA_ORIENTATION=+
MCESGDLEAYPSDLDDEMENVHNKRQKMTEEERLTRCRERNKMHARNTRERKKSQMDGLQCRIQELVDQRKLLQSSNPESSVASILMSLAGLEGPKPEGVDSNSNTTVFRIEGDDDISKSIEKLKMQVSMLLGDDDKEAIDLDPLLMKDKSTCSTSELEMIRRERNRVHAKKTRLKKKKMVQEMETIIVSLEKEVTDLQGNLMSALPKPTPQPRSVQMRTVIDETNSYPSGPLAVQKRLIEAILPNEMINDIKVSNSIRPDLVSEAPSSSSKKRKHQVDQIESRGQHVNVPVLKTVVTPSTDAADNVVEEQGGRGSTNSWPQHKFRNAMKAVSSCLESGSEGSGNEENVSSKAVIHSPVDVGDSHTSCDSSPRECNSNSETDNSPCNTTFPIPAVCNRSVPEASLAFPCISVASQSLKTIQAILASCGPKIPVQITKYLNDANIDSLCLPNNSNAGLPDLHNGGIPTDLVKAVASTYPLCALASEDAHRQDARQYSSFSPMNQSVPSTSSSISQKVGNHDFPLYGGSGNNSMLPLKKRMISMQECVRNPIPQELDFIEAPAAPSVYSLNIPMGIEVNHKVQNVLFETPLELRRKALQSGKTNGLTGPTISERLIFKTLETLPPSL